ncbi:MAG: hypothetical protein OEV41_00405 [Gammaproteobacteria bacterium]|nr:hypothetical protein [Gammaproteobacteria bacterium]
MSFAGPDRRDYDNVVSLNYAYLRCLKRRRGEGLGGLTVPGCHRLIDLDEHESSRLAEVPFLLFSFREQDDRYWDRLLDGSGSGDLFRAAASAEFGLLTSAALGFIWRLANQNPYSLRLFCGATLYWCERIADLTICRLLDAVRAAGDVPLPRLAENQAMWRKLIDEGTSRESRVRQAAHFVALQTVLTDASAGRSQETLSLAARRSRVPGLKVADK